MPHMKEQIETTLRVTASDEATASRVGEILARVAVALSAEDVTVMTDVERFKQHCHHPEHDDDEAHL